MEVAYRDKKLAQSLHSLKISGLPFGEPCLSWTPPGDNEPGLTTWSDQKCHEEVFRIPLAGKLADFDIALMPTGLMSLREYQPSTMKWKILFHQTNPGHLVDLARDLEVGSSCVHLQEKSRAQNPSR